MWIYFNDWICINPDNIDAKTLNGATLSTVLNKSDTEIPTSKAVSTALSNLDATDLGTVSYSTVQELTGEQRKQARDNISAIDADYLYYKQPPIYRVDTSNSLILKIYINIRDLNNGGYYYFNTDKQVPENTATVHQLIYIAVCDDGTEVEINNNSGMSGYQLGMPIRITNILNTDNNHYVGGINNLYTNIAYRVVGTADTVSNLTSDIIYNAQYLGSNNSYEFIPTSDYNPATKKYVDDSVGAIPQSDWNQTDETAIDYIKNKPEIATDDEIIEMLTQEDMFPVVTDSDGSILADENGDILLW